MIERTVTTVIAPPTPPPLPAEDRTRADTVPPPPRLRKLRLAAVLLVVGVGLGLLYAFNPAEAKFFPPCPLNKLTGLHCPGCGTTRALHHLLHGRVGRAFDYNPLLVASMPWIVYALGRDGYRFVLPRPTASRRLRPWALWTIAAVVIAYGVARNLPYPGFAWMAP